MVKILYIEGRREGYAVNQLGKTFTVREMIDFLEQFDDDAMLVLNNDNGYTFGTIDADSFREKYYRDMRDADGDEEEDE